jgi:hypothetical protein
VNNQNQSVIQNMERYNMLKHMEAVKRSKLLPFNPLFHSDKQPVVEYDEIENQLEVPDLQYEPRPDADEQAHPQRRKACRRSQLVQYG